MMKKLDTYLQMYNFTNNTFAQKRLIKWSSNFLTILKQENKNI